MKYQKIDQNDKLKLKVYTKFYGNSTEKRDNLITLQTIDITKSKNTWQLDLTISNIWKPPIFHVTSKPLEAWRAQSETRSWRSADKK